MKLLDSERILSRINTGEGELVLTSHRVVHGWQNKSTSIMLEDVGSVIMARLTHRWILFVTGMCILMAASLVTITLHDGGLGPVDTYRRLASALLFISAFLVATFGVKRFSMVLISSPAATIAFRIRNMIRKDINRFLLELDRARIVWYFADKTGRRAPRPGAARPRLQR